jgi:hypothetical protein
VGAGVDDVRGRGDDRVVLGGSLRRLDSKSLYHLQRIDDQVQIRVVAKT